MKRQKASQTEFRVEKVIQKVTNQNFTSKTLIIPIIVLLIY